MLRVNDIKLTLDHTEEELSTAILDFLAIDKQDLLSYKIIKRSFDARKKTAIVLIYQLDIELTTAVEQSLLQQHAHQNFIRPAPDTSYHFVATAEDNFPLNEQQRPIIIGFGPCGILAALVLAQMGLKPIVLERGRDVKQRTRDTWGLWRERKLDTESNVQFGEGGAGTFSDGKLYSQVKDKRHLGRKVLEEFVKAGAPEEILYISKPHIGTFKLVKMVQNMRAEIARLGGEIRFQQRVTDLYRLDTAHDDNDPGAGRVTGVELSSGEVIHSRHVILAIGHSARDTFRMLHERNVYIEAKPFSIGFRIEHPQSVVDRARFGDSAGHPLLGAADYKLVHHGSDQRSVTVFVCAPAER